MRSRMRNPGFKSYVPEFDLNKPLTNFGVGEVLNVGEGATAKKGDLVYGYFEFAEYVKFDAETVKSLRIFDNKEKLPLSTWVGAAGMPGQTARHGLLSIGKPKKGETIFVSSASFVKFPSSCSSFPPVLPSCFPPFPLLLLSSPRFLLSLTSFPPYHLPLPHCSPAEPPFSFFFLFAVELSGRWSSGLLIELGARSLLALEPTRK